MQISFVIPTRNRSHELRYTLEQLQGLNLDELGGPSELVIVDNGSEHPMELPKALDNGLAISQVKLGENRGAGARNVGAGHARGDWIIMLDDDSNLRPGRIGEYLSQVDPAIGAVGGEIFLPDGSHEAGGLPEVVIGCGCAIRRDAFLEVGGYDARFGYYAEEYDLCAKLIAGGYRVCHTRAFAFEHRKSSLGRDMNEILYRLVRNNGWMIQRYAPDAVLDEALGEMKVRYEQIALKEQAIEGYRRGVDELNRTIGDQKRSALGVHAWDRFVGVDAMRSTLEPVLRAHASGGAMIVGPARGKGLGHIRTMIQGCSVSIVEHGDDVLRVIGTLSPGPMLDVLRAHPDAVCPWMIEELASIGSQG